MEGVVSLLLSVYMLGNGGVTLSPLVTPPILSLTHQHAGNCEQQSHKVLLPCSPNPILVGEAYETSSFIRLLCLCFSLPLCCGQVSLGPWRNLALKASWLQLLAVLSSAETVLFLFLCSRLLSDACLRAFLSGVVWPCLTCFCFSYWILVKVKLQTTQDPALQTPGWT